MALRLSALDLQRCYSSYKQDVQGQLPDFHADWVKASADDKEKIFRRELVILNDSYKKLGLIGERFVEAFAATGCRETKVLDGKQTPAFQGHNFSKGFLNEIFYGLWSFDGREKFQDSSNHERTHAIQHAISAISHAIPYNGHTFSLVESVAGFPAGASCRIVLAPRAYVLIEELKERGSYSMQKILSELRSGNFKPEEQLGKNLQDYAATVLEKWDVASSNPVISHLTHYRDYSLRNYKFMMLDTAGEPQDDNVIYVVPDEKDIAALGHICGLTMFGDKTDDMSRWMQTPYSDAHQKSADELTAKLGADKAVSFRAALTAMGMTPQQFLARCREPLLQKTPVISPSSATGDPVAVNLSVVPGAKPVPA